MLLFVSGLYRIISVEGTKAVINSTITPNMTFTKTSQKFGQWSDIRANTVYGLGFGSEVELNKVRVGHFTSFVSQEEFPCIHFFREFSAHLSYMDLLDAS